MHKKTKKATDAVKILHGRYVIKDAGRLASIEAEKNKLNIAAQIHSLRQRSGLTQKQLAAMMGTTQSVISRIENANYASERIDTLQKLAAALNCHLELRFVPANC